MGTAPVIEGFHCLEMTDFLLTLILGLTGGNIKRQERDEHRFGWVCYPGASSQFLVENCVLMVHQDWF